LQDWVGDPHQREQNFRKGRSSKLAPD